MNGLANWAFDCWRWAGPVIVCHRVHLMEREGQVVGSAYVRPLNWSPPWFRCGDCRRELFVRRENWRQAE